MRFFGFYLAVQSFSISIPYFEAVLCKATHTGELFSRFSMSGCIMTIGNKNTGNEIADLWTDLEDFLEKLHIGESRGQCGYDSASFTNGSEEFFIGLLCEMDNAPELLFVFGISFIYYFVC
jgi:hypothetical protein